MSSTLVTFVSLMARSHLARSRLPPLPHSSAPCTGQLVSQPHHATKCLHGGQIPRQFPAVSFDISWGRSARAEVFPPIVPPPRPSHRYHHLTLGSGPSAASSHRAERGAGAVNNNFRPDGVTLSWPCGCMRGDGTATSRIFVSHSNSRSAVCARSARAGPRGSMKCR